MKTNFENIDYMKSEHKTRIKNIVLNNLKIIEKLLLYDNIVLFIVIIFFSL